MEFSTALTLTLEQEFNLKLYEEMAKKLSKEQAQEYLLEVLRQLMIKDNFLKQLMRSNMLD
ncbi:MAG: NblA/ycf18 family protein [Nostocaceae cyanobacterium]|nr:NblA/ycf18 family protein [Nostocaceae cyanobacterium]